MHISCKLLFIANILSIFCTCENASENGWKMHKNRETKLLHEGQMGMLYLPYFNTVFLNPF